MARECFCGCGRPVGRELKRINKAGVEIKHLTGTIETYGQPMTEAYLLHAERTSSDPEEVEGAREAVVTSRQLAEDAHGVQAMVATAIHEQDPSQVLLENLKLAKDKLMAIDVHTRLTCNKIRGLKYEQLPTLGAEGIVTIVERAER